MREFTHRSAAVRSINALAAMEQRCGDLQRDWSDLDNTLVNEFGYLADKIRHLSREIVETYPGRSAAQAGFAAPRLLILLALLVMALGSAMASASAPARGPLGPHGHALPAWVRIVDHDGQVLDLSVIEVATITLCPRSGSTDIWSAVEGTGMAMIDTGAGIARVSYAVKYYNEGRVTGNPDTTGDQLLLIEDPDILHSDGGGEGCVRYAYGAITP